jgi:FKBP-type peptidyl-prolyl cis-trans isomerase SlyD
MRNIIPGLEDALEGKAKGDTLNVSIPPAEGYGERIDGLSREVPRSAFDGAGELQIGMQFRAQSEDQREVIFTITALEGDNVTIDGNHPLAGETLNFDVEVMDVREATQEELDHGHVHGSGGHHH